MKTPIKDGGPAFPFFCQGPTTAPEIYYGMTLRDWFAGKAIAPTIDTHCGAMQEGKIHSSEFAKCVAKSCYQFADAMIAEREKGGQ